MTPERGGGVAVRMRARPELEIERELVMEILIVFVRCIC